MNFRVLKSTRHLGSYEDALRVSLREKNKIKKDNTYLTWEPNPKTLGNWRLLTL